MKYVEVIADAGCVDTIVAIASSGKALDVRVGAASEDGMRQVRLLVNDDKLQAALDGLQNVLSTQPAARIVVLPVEATLPKPAEAPGKPRDSAVAAREALYQEVEKSTRLDMNFLVLVVLSTMVAAIGLIENNVAVVVGAMVIAPLLGPNLALSLGTALGDLDLVRKSAQTLSVGILLAVLLSVLIGGFLPSHLSSTELMSRTRAGLDSIALALASGAAASLSLTTGLSSVMVGVMVAVALLPPAAALGIMLGQRQFELATDAGLLLAVNIVCVNLASKIVFYVRGIRPRTWLEKEKAKRATFIYVLGWLVSLLILMAIIYARGSLARHP
ncbi:MAG: TIGR00341 family protein [Sinobacteraceae bacterium]|nr:TIGR00341 family protein [Nevskiaceae bacterium]